MLNQLVFVIVTGEVREDSGQKTETDDEKVSKMSLMVFVRPAQSCCSGSCLDGVAEVL